MNKKLIIILIIIISTFLIVLGGLYFYSKYKLGFMTYEPINKNDISVNNNLFDEVKTNVNDVTKKDFDSIQNYVFFGSDSRIVDDIEAGRSDTIMICSINPKTKSVKLLSIPRDTYVNIPGYGMDKINHAYAYGKEQLSIKTINQNFNLNIEKYITIDFSGLIDVINQVGGIELNIDKDEMIYINNRLKDLKPYTTNKLTPVAHYGLVTLTGEQALCHSRNRTTGEGNDFARTDRQRQVVEALMKKISTLPYDKILSISNTLLKDVKTNATSEEFMKLFAGLYPAKDVYSKNIILAQIPSVDYSLGKMINGVYYFTTDFNKAKQDFIEYIYNK